MNIYLIAIATLVFAYLMGSINFAVIISSLFMKKDVRSMGSGNAGATNVLRNGGVLPGVLTFLLDALKGFVACYVGKIAFEYIEKNSDFWWSKAVYGIFACGLLCMIGHVLPVFFQFKGGKGVATSVGIFYVCSPISISLGLAVFAILVVVSRMVSLASIIATLVVVSFTIILYDAEPSIIPVVVLTLIMGFIVIFKHRSNIKRILNGTESKFGKGGK